MDRSRFCRLVRTYGHPQFYYFVLSNPLRFAGLWQFLQLYLLHLMYEFLPDLFQSKVDPLRYKSPAQPNHLLGRLPS